jgi:DNA polymerase-1
VLFGISKNGIPIDMNEMARAEVAVLEELSVCEAECLKRIPDAIKERHEGKLNLNRRLLIAETLFSPDGFDLTPISYTAKNKEPQVNKDTLKKLKRAGNKAARDFIEWKEQREELHSVHSKYLKNLQKFVASDGRIHPSMSISFTSSGRVGARAPNTMVFPARNRKQAKIVKGLFVASDGYKFVNVDQSQSELRFLAHITQDTRLLEAFRNDEDIHTITATGMVERSGKRWESLTKEEQKEARQKAKPVNFGLPFGMSCHGLREYALNDYGIHLSKKEASERWNGWHNLYPGVRLWHDECKSEMYADGKVRTIFGRNRWLPNLKSREEWMVAEAERTGINVLIQGPSSDYTLLGTYQAYQEGLIDTPDAKLVNFVHDSDLFEVKEEIVMDFSLEIKRILENVDTSDFGFELSVPMKVDIQIGDNLAALEEIDL